MRIITQIKKVFSEFVVLLKEEQRKEMEAIRMGKDYEDEDDYSHAMAQENSIFRYGPLDSDVNPYGSSASIRDDREFWRRHEEYYESYNRFPQ